MHVFIMKRKNFKKILGNFKNKAYDAQGDYWWNLANVIFVVVCAVIALISYLLR